MKDNEQLQALERIYRAERHCFIRYLVDGSSPESIDSADAKVRGLIETWARDSASNTERIERIFRAEDHVPDQGSWTLAFTQYNFLRYRYLPGPVKSRMQALVTYIEAQAKALGEWPAANSAVKELLTAHGANLEKLEAVAADLPADEDAAQPAGERRQTSANFW